MFQQIVASGFGTGGFDRGFSEIDLCRLAIRAAKFGPDADWLVGGGTHVGQKAFRKTQIISDSQLTFFRGTKGAVRIPSLSFQYLRRPGRTAKLLYFLTGGGFESQRLHQLCFFNPLVKSSRALSALERNRIACLNFVRRGGSKPGIIVGKKSNTCIIGP
jgi:hypothetical protein